MQFLSRDYRVSHKHFSGGASTPIGEGPGVEDGGNQRLVGEAVYISSCLHIGIYNSLTHSCIPIPSLYLIEGEYPS